MESKLEIARKLKQIEMSVETIAQATDLDADAIEGL